MRPRARDATTIGCALAMAMAGAALLLVGSAADAQDGGGICDGLCGTACHEMLTGEGPGRRRAVVASRHVAGISIARLFVRGPIAPRAVRERVVSRFAPLRICSTASGGRGRITMRLVVTSAGAVQEIEQVASTLRNGAADQCVASILRALTFPSTGERPPTEVRLTLALR